MRKAQKQEILGITDSLHQIHEKIKKALEQENLILAQNMLSETQESAIALGGNLEKTEGEGHVTVSHIEEYCELLFHVYEDIDKNDFNVNRVYKMLRRQLINIENSIKNDITVRTEIVFFPYKASMWDSLESIYFAAKADSDCDVYCVPIPYYNLNADHSFGEMHYEGSEYPEEIEVTEWQEYNFEERRPDVIYIHNPYDNCNLVTSVHPRFYSNNLKKYTDALVYVPYYMTSGEMSERQSFIPPYMNMDYIVIQSPKFREYFDVRIPDKKFLPFGSPKADRVIRKCQNSPIPPKEWKLSNAQLEKMTEKKIYFYNTSIAGMLADTENFLKKMQYVFKCFEEHDNACILWRPHPLLEATFHSMRPEYEQEFLQLKKYFVENDIGILDMTADIENSIALSDAYVGDAGTSVTALFGVAGKPIFILNNMIHEKPDKDSWRERMGISFAPQEQDMFVITQGNKLYVSVPGKYNYRYFCDLSDNQRKEYGSVLQIDGKKYVCPLMAQNILILGDNGVERKVELQREDVDGQTFVWAWKYDRFIILLPLNYPALVRFDTETEEFLYIRDNIDVYIKEEERGKIIGGSVLYSGKLYLASPVDNKLCIFDIESGEIQVIELPLQSKCGCKELVDHYGEFWLLPYNGKIIVRWNPKTNETEEYTGFPDEFKSVKHMDGEICDELLFAGMAFYGDYLYLSPCYANMFLRLDVNTGQFVRWKTPIDEDSEKNRIIRGVKNRASYFLQWEAADGSDSLKLYSNGERRLYNVNMKTDIWEEIEIKFDMEELQEHTEGFRENIKKLRYACQEDIFNSLDRFIDGKIVESNFDRDRQLFLYNGIIANIDGSCGRKVHEYIKAHA